MRRANHVAVSFLLPGLLLIAGCRGTDGNPSEKVDVSFSILGTDTRTTSTGGEGNVAQWTLLLYREGKLIDIGTSGSNSPIQCSLKAGSYTACAIVNPPSSFRPEAYSSFSKLSGAESDLRDNSLSQLVMSGSRTISVSGQNDRPQSIGVNRLVSKVGIRKISIDFSDPTLRSRTFRLKAIYLTNCYGKNHLNNDGEASGMNADASCWYNRMGFHSDTGVDALLSDRNINTVITVLSPYKKEHHFYCYPNRADRDSRSGEWSIRHTRLVLEAEIDEKTYFYPITLPAMQRNKTYIIEEAIIQKLGSNDPEKDEPGSIDVVYETSVSDWDPTFTVQENS